MYAYCLNDPINCTDPSGNLPPWLERAIDPQYNPRTAKAVDAFVQGSLAWVGISNMYRQTWRYTTGAISEGRWEDAGRGYRALTQEHFELGKAAVKIPGQVFGGILMAPVRIFTTDIPTLWAAGAERLKGQGREWDIVFAALGLAGDVCLTAKMIQIGTDLYAQTVKPNRSTQPMVERNGFRFTERYYNKLWQTGRKAPSLIAQEVLEANHFKPIPVEVASRPGQQFNLYRAYSGAGSGGWELVYSPVTHEVFHLMPIENVEVISTFHHITILTQ